MKALDRIVRPALAAWLAIVLLACGGGVGTGGTGTFAEGPITGFGSIVVNGVHFDESTARIEDDDGAPLGAAALRLGMVVQVQAGPIDEVGGVRTAQATLVRVSRALVGPVVAVDVADARFAVLGQTVQATADTVFDERLANGVAGLQSAPTVEVYASFDAATGRYVATRVAPAPRPEAKVAGPATRIDLVSHTVQIGGQSYSFAAIGSLAGVAEGAQLSVTLQGGLDGAGHWIVSGQGSSGPEPSEAQQVDVRGLVQAVASPTRFTVEGRVVDSATARVDGEVAVGASVKVSGVLRDGVLVASRVNVDNRASPQLFEVKGAVGGLDTARRRFIVRGTTISYAAADVQFVGGGAAQLAPGRKVEVQGRLSADRSVLEATRITFDD
jgi:hypothetical protein